MKLCAVGMRKAILGMTQELNEVSIPRIVISGIYQSVSKTVLYMFTIHQIFSLVHDWSKSVTLLNAPAKIQFSNVVRCEKYLTDNKHKSPHFARRYARISVLELKYSADKSKTLTSNFLPLIVKTTADKSQ